MYHALTSACWVHSNVYGLGNIQWIRYLTVVDPFLSTSSAAVQRHRHMTSASVKTPWTENSSSIGEEPVSWGRRLATSSLVSHAEQGIVTFTNVLEGHDTEVLVCCISEWEPDITCTWDPKYQHQNVVCNKTSGNPMHALENDNFEGIPIWALTGLLSVSTTHAWINNTSIIHVVKKLLTLPPPPRYVWSTYFSHSLQLVSSLACHAHFFLKTAKVLLHFLILHWSKLSFLACINCQGVITGCKLFS